MTMVTAAPRTLLRDRTPAGICRPVYALPPGAAAPFIPEAIGLAPCRATANTTSLSLWPLIVISEGLAMRGRPGQAIVSPATLDMR